MGFMLQPSKETWYGPTSLSAQRPPREFAMPAKKRKWTRGMGAVAAGSLTAAQRQTLRRKQTSRRRNARIVVPRDKLGFATSMVSTLRYTDRFEFNPTNTNTAVASFRANGLWDPDERVGYGHQPRGFDEMMSIYKTFTVTSSKIFINWMYEGYDGPSQTDSTGKLIKTFDESTDAPSVSPIICGIMRSATGYGQGIPVQQQMEKDRTTWKVLTPQSGAEVTSAKSGLSDFFGKQDLVAAEGYSGYAEGATGADPDNQAHYHVFAARASDDYPADTSKVVAYITIEYRATFTEPKPLAQST